jgi:hypothetical protein
VVVAACALGTGGCGASLMDKANDARWLWQVQGDCATARQVADEVVVEGAKARRPDKAAIGEARWVRGECTLETAAKAADPAAALTGAEQDLRAVVAEDPGAVLAVASLAKLERMLGRPAECAKVLEPSLRKPCPEACSAHGEAPVDCLLRCHVRRALRGLCLVETGSSAGVGGSLEVALREVEAERGLVPMAGNNYRYVGGYAHFVQGHYAKALAMFGKVTPDSGKLELVPGGKVELVKTPFLWVEPAFQGKINATGPRCEPFFMAHVAYLATGQAEAATALAPKLKDYAGRGSCPQGWALWMEATAARLAGVQPAELEALEPLSAELRKAAEALAGRDKGSAPEQIEELAWKIEARRKSLLERVDAARHKLGEAIERTRPPPPPPEPPPEPPKKKGAKGGKK